MSFFDNVLMMMMMMMMLMLSYCACAALAGDHDGRESKVRARLRMRTVAGLRLHLLPGVAAPIRTGRARKTNARDGMNASF